MPRRYPHADRSEANRTLNVVAAPPTPHEKEPARHPIRVQQRHIAVGAEVAHQPVQHDGVAARWPWNTSRARLFLGLAAVEAPSVPSIRVRSHPSPRLRVLIRPSHPVRLLATPTATPDHQPNADPRQVGAQVISVEPSAAATVTVSAAEEHLVQVSTTIPGFTRQGAGAKPPLGHGRGGRRGPGGLAVPVARIELLSAALRAAAARRPTRPRSLGLELRRSSGTDPRDQMIPRMRSRPGKRCVQGIK